MRLVAAVVLLLSSAYPALGLDLRECNRPLGMESGRIRDDQLSASSAFDSLSTGAQHARARLSTGGGAWCPQAQINSSSKEWIQVTFDVDTVIVAVETQGRYDEGRGREFASAYRLEYWRPSLGRWVAYTSMTGDQILAGNVDTRSSAVKRLEGGRVVRRLRLIPVSDSTRTVCMRFELFGCPYTGSLASYEMRDGNATLGTVSLKDTSYDGQQESEILSGGLGRLYDGEFGGDALRWVGWQSNGRHGLSVALNLTFSQLVYVTAVSFHATGVLPHSPVLRAARIEVKAKESWEFGGETGSGGKKVIREAPLDVAGGRWIRVRLEEPGKWAQGLKITLEAAGTSLKISEIHVHAASDSMHSVSYDDDEEEAELWSNENGDSFFGTTELFAVVGILSLTTIICFALVCWHRSIQRRSFKKDFYLKQNRLVSPSTYRMTAENMRNSLLERQPVFTDYGDYADPDAIDCGTFKKPPPSECCVHMTPPRTPLLKKIGSAVGLYDDDNGGYSEVSLQSLVDDKREDEY